MTIIEYEASFGDEKKLVSITRPYGAGDTYRLLVNNYYLGDFIKYQGQWYFSTSKLYSDDIMILIDMIEAHTCSSAR